MNTPTVTMFYDGLCPLCSREIAHYRKRAPADRVEFVDIAAPGFDAAAFGLDAQQIHRQIHVKVGAEVRVGVDAFIAFWREVPGYRWLASVASTPGVHGVFCLGYWAFAKVRPWLPRRKAALCTTDRCQR